MPFQALLADQFDGGCRVRLTSLELERLPEEAVLVEVTHSALNYKDALAVCGNRNKVMKSLPFVPGIDLAGVVVESSAAEFEKGDEVFCTGWGLGERHWGGFAGFARLKAEWLLRLPPGMSLRQTMALGTAGLTAMLSVEALERAGIRPASGRILVTGASGGVGSLSILLLGLLGYTVVASTGSPEQAGYLRSLGASEILPRAELDRDARPLEKEIWAGAIDTVGGRTLATVLSQTKYDGTVASCGLAGGFDLPTTVMPFILRNVALQGVDSVYFPKDRRASAWRRLAEFLPAERIESIARDVSLHEVPALAEQMLKGQTRGRLIVTLKP